MLNRLAVLGVTGRAAGLFSGRLPRPVRRLHQLAQRPLH